MAPKRFCLGIDLHGTLLNKDEVFPKNRLDSCLKLLKRLKNRVSAVTCTGNDLSFVQRVLPSPLLDELEGFVLETGCSFASSCTSPEQVFVDDDTVLQKEKLEQLLKEKRFPEVTRFGRRLASISLFTRDPRSFNKTITSLVEQTGYSRWFSVTYSSVAVDVIPLSFDKLTGLRRAAGNGPVIAIADSVNDIPLLAGADYSFAPANLAEEAARRLIKSGRDIVRLDKAHGLDKNVVFRSGAPEVDGVIEILRFLDAALK